jgi:hypothetical protein
LGADDAATIQAVADALKAGFPTYVVGISTANTPAETTLNSMAKAGGVARAAAPYFYSVTSSADLETSLKAIAGKVATCNYPLAPVSATNDPNNVAIHISGASVPQDPQNGWDFTGPDHTAIKLSGTACEKVMNSADTKVEVFYGCPGDPPVP